MTDIEKSDKSVEDSDSLWYNLQGLQITKGELKHLTGFDLSSIPLHKPSALRRAISERRILLFLFASSVILICLLLVWSIVWIIISVADINNALAISAILFLPIPVGIYGTIRTIFANKRISKSILPLLEEVIKYNQIAKIVEVQDQLEAVGNLVVLADKKKIGEALELTRTDLVCALKTERILRENKDIINIRPELFENNLAALRALDISEKAGKSSQLINEALQVAIDVQEEMKKIQNYR